MSISFQVGRKRFEIGHSSLLTAFFSTIVVLLEGEVRGRQFPALTRELFRGRLEHARSGQAAFELREVRLLMANHPPSDLVWDIDDRKARPPWGTDISPKITSLANYLVTSDGKDLIDEMLDAFAESMKCGRDVEIV